MTHEEFIRSHPSHANTHTEPHGWIQWKGTDVCLDLHCECGKLSHFDGDFCYHIKCGYCGKVYECDGHIRIHQLDFEPEETKVSEVDEETRIDRLLEQR